MAASEERKALEARIEQEVLTEQQAAGGWSPAQIAEEIARRLARIDAQAAIEADPFLSEAQAKERRLWKIVGWLEQQPGAEEYLGWINQGTPAEEALASFEFDTGRKMPEEA